jgi:SAM-dependent methyltransferase
VVDRQFAEPHLAALYDLMNSSEPRADFAFYLPLVMAARSVLDIGCGTGELLRRAREAGHTGRLCGVDPADAMLDVARRRPDIEWTRGDATSVASHGAFELIVMTGHAFQVLLDDDDIHAALSAIHDAIAPNGRFAFETRNPSARAWEQWTPEHAVEYADDEGFVVRMAHRVEQPFDGRTVSFVTTYTSERFTQPETSHSSLRFLTANELATALAEAGFVVEEQYGDWDRSPLTDVSPEIITVASQASIT